MRLMVIGYARHGKDTVCDILRNDFGLRFVSSSYFCLERCVVQHLAAKGITYPSLDAAYNDRVNHRALWHDAIRLFNKDDDARLGRELFAAGYDIYCGLRSIEEFEALRKENAFDAALWVDRSRWVDPEPVSSMTIGPAQGDVWIDNNHDLVHLRVEVHHAMKHVAEIIRSRGR